MESGLDMGQGRKGSWASWGSEQSPERPLGMYTAFLSPPPLSSSGNLVSHLYFFLPDAVLVIFLYSPVFSASQSMQWKWPCQPLIVCCPRSGASGDWPEGLCPHSRCPAESLAISVWVGSVSSNQLWALGVVVTPGAHPWGSRWHRSS